MQDEIRRVGYDNLESFYGDVLDSSARDLISLEVGGNHHRNASSYVPPKNTSVGRGKSRLEHSAQRLENTINSSFGKVPWVTRVSRVRFTKPVLPRCNPSLAAVPNFGARSYPQHPSPVTSRHGSTAASSATTTAANSTQSGEATTARTITTAAPWTGWTSAWGPSRSTPSFRWPPTTRMSGRRRPRTRPAGELLRHSKVTGAREFSFRPRPLPMFPFVQF